MEFPMMRAMDGVLLVDKDRGRTSHDIVEMVRWLCERTKVGHAGSLDPNATGLLILCMGRATKVVEYLMGLDKSYEADFELGVTTDTDDADGVELSRTFVSGVGIEQVRETLARYVGTIQQKPPVISAVKVGGEASHRRARRGAPIAPAARSVTVRAIEMTACDLPRVSVRIECGSGTYVRSLARDVGRDLGCGAIVAALRRTRVGSMRVEDAVKEGDLTREAVEAGAWPIERALAFMPAVELDEADAKKFAQGQRVERQVEALVRVFGPQGPSGPPGGFIGVGRAEGGLRADCVIYGA